MRPRPRNPARILALAVLLVGGCGDGTPPADSPATSLTGALGAGSAPGFRQALEPVTLRFPGDHGPHREFRNEWWYVTGNLETDGGRRLGYQLTLFRIGLAPGTPDRPSRLAVNHVYMGHLALSDAGSGRFRYAQRFARPALGMAGAQPLSVWLEDWRMDSRAAGGRCRGCIDMTLEAGTGEFAISLRLEAEKPVVLQGEEGLSRKSATPGNASYYYSLTRLDTRGTVRIGSQELQVHGRSWLDREWSTSALDEGQEGWDWFALHLDDGRDLMFYRLRREDGSVDPMSAGSLVEQDGTRIALDNADVSVTATGEWTSPHSNITWPSGWRLRIPAHGLVLELEPLLRDQELGVAVTYWEGAVRVAGSETGRGYVELTGY